MSGIRKRCIECALIVAMLVGCSSEKSERSSLPVVFAGAFSQVVNSKGRGITPKRVVSQDDFAKITVPILQVNPEVRGGSDFLQKVATRFDSAQGVVVIWESSDKAQIFLRDGVVVGSRGVGGDIIAADAGSTLSALKRQGEGSGLRNFIVSDGDVTTTDYAFRCDVVNLGEEVISVSIQSFRTSHMQETCLEDGADLRVVRNDYWVEKSSGFIRKSRQWMGPRIGYFEILAVKK